MPSSPARAAGEEPAGLRPGPHRAGACPVCGDPPGRLEDHVHREHAGAGV